MSTQKVLQQAIRLHQSGRLQQAEKLYLSVLQSEPSNENIHNLIGAIYCEMGLFDKAEEHLKKAVKLHPQFVQAHYHLGKTLFHQKHYYAATKSLVKATDMKPSYLKAHFLLATAYVAMGRAKEAKKHYLWVLKYNPKNVEANANLGNVLQEMGDDAGATTYYQQALAFDGQFVPALIGYGNVLRQQGKDQAAMALYQSHPHWQDDGELLLQCSNLYKELGDMQQAQALVTQSIALNPKLAQAYNQFSIVVQGQQKDVTMVREVITNGTITGTDLEYVYFALGKLEEDVQNYSAAAAAYIEGNRLHRSRYDYKITTSERLFNVIKKSYKADFLVTEACSDLTTSRPIFVLGMPRSGTTLVEQIIASHSQVYGAGELSFISQLASSRNLTMAQLHRLVQQGNKAFLSDLGEKYLRKINNLDIAAPRLTDKMPHNFLNMGIIAKILPNAKIVHCQRHPVANALSIFKAAFSGKAKQPYAYQLRELGLYHNLYEDLMAHWREVMPGRFYEIKYEELTQNQEQQTRQLLAYCDLPWENACMNFHQSKRKIKTASASQVRKPMSNRSVHLWKHYASSLQPLLDVLFIPQEYQN